MKKTIELGMEKVIAIIIVLVLVTIVIAFMMGDEGPMGWVNSLLGFMNATSELAIN